MDFYANGPAMFGMGVALSVLSVVATGLRFYIRLSHNQGLGADDWLIMPAVLATIGMAISIIIGVQNHAVGYPTGYNELGDIDATFVIVEKVIFAVFLIDMWALTFAKLSIVYFYRRVFHTGHNKWFNWITIALTVFIICWGIAFFFSILFSCGTHWEANWGTYDEYLEYCFPSQQYNVVFVATDMFADVVLLVLPIPMILRLKMSVARRAAIILIFSIGALTMVTSVIRVVYFAYIYEGVMGGVINVDPILNASVFMYWTLLESGLAVIVSCLPTFQIWFRKITVDTVIKNVRGIFSVQSLSRSSRGSTRQKSRDATSEDASLQRMSFEMVTSKGDKTEP